MEIYLVRHGKTNGNVSWRHQHTNTPLNEEGEAQAKRVTEKIVALAPTHLISSPNVRALETARIINDSLPHLIIDTNPVFRELERPSYLTGNYYLTQTTIKYIFNWFFGRAVGDGEDYNTFLARLAEAKSYLETLPADARVILVTHSVFTIHFLHYIKKERKMTLVGAVAHLFKVLTLENTAITKLEVLKNTDKIKWCLGNC